MIKINPITPLIKSVIGYIYVCTKSIKLQDRLFHGPCWENPRSSFWQKNK